MYTSIDPAPPTTDLLAGKGSPEAMTDAAIAKLKAQLLDTKLPLFDRYRAMFSLRNIGTPAAVDALAAGFDDESALFKWVSLSDIRNEAHNAFKARNRIRVRPASLVTLCTLPHQGAQRYE